MEASSGDPVDATDESGASGPFWINLASETRPNSGTYTVRNIQSDVVVYITIIGSADSESALMAQVSRQEPAITPGTPRTIKVDEDFRSNPEDMNGNPLQVQGEEPGVAKLYSGNNWKYEWDNLKASDLQSNPYYYYVDEVSSSAPQDESYVAIVQTTSSNGLSSGTIHVKNTMQAVKVKLRKRDSRKLNGKNVPIEGGEFYYLGH